MTNLIKLSEFSKLMQLFLKVWLTFVCAIWGISSYAIPVPLEALNQLSLGQPVDLIIEYNSASIETDAETMRAQRHLTNDDDVILTYKSGRYQYLKNNIDLTVTFPDIEPVAEYSHLPLSFKRFHTVSSLNTYIARPEVKAVYLNTPLYPVLTQSLPLISQPAVSTIGYRGLGSTVAVIDNGIDYANTAFGPCTSPGVPANCHVSVSLNFGTGTIDTLHGTNVSAIILGVAPDSRIAMLNAFSGTSALTADVISAINWSIANKFAYNIVALNMSLGDGSSNLTPCSTNNAFSTPVNNAINAGITIVAAAGNDAFTNALNKPACTPGIVSVGAVYDSDLSTQGFPTGVAWGTLCTDSLTAADKITCFSDSASYLTLLAPGALITAAGITEGGTSQASPHVAGAVAVLRAAFPLETLPQILLRLTSSGTMIFDPRNGITKPRLNLLEAARPANDMFNNRAVLQSNSGNKTITNLLATREIAEPIHAGNTGGHSVWWKLTPSTSGQLSIDTHGSSFDTVLATYSGTNLATLTSIASNDNDGSPNGASSVLLQVQAGNEYQIAVDGANGANGATNLNWSLNTNALANLAINLSGPLTATTFTPTTYSITVANAGPQAATHVMATLTLPSGTNLISASPGCGISGNVVKCDIGTLQNGTQAALTLQLQWNLSVSSAAISSVVMSDLPDPNLTDNNSSIQMIINPATLYSPTNDNTDVPTLPQWGILLLSLSFVIAAAHIQRKTNVD